MLIRCKNRYCPYNKEDIGNYRTICSYDGQVEITETAECETYWYATSCGKGRDLREIPLSENPRLEPMYQRKS